MSNTVSVSVARLERIVSLLEQATAGLVGRDVPLCALKDQSLATGLLEAIAHPMVPEEESVEDLKKAYELLYAENARLTTRIEQLEAALRSEIDGVPI